MKTLTFADDQPSKDRFQIIYQGFLLGAPEGGLKGIEVHRRALKIMDKLETISKPLFNTNEPPEQLFFPTGDAVRELVEEGGALQLEDVEISMLKAHIENVSWRVALSKAVVDTDDFLANAPTA